MIVGREWVQLIHEFWVGERGHVQIGCRAHGIMLKSFPFVDVDAWKQQQYNLPRGDATLPVTIDTVLAHDTFLGKVRVDEQPASFLPFVD